MNNSSIRGAGGLGPIHNFEANYCASKVDENRGLWVRLGTFSKNVNIQYSLFGCFWKFIFPFFCNQNLIVPHKSHNFKK